MRLEGKAALHGIGYSPNVEVPKGLAGLLTRFAAGVTAGGAVAV